MQTETDPLLQPVDRVIAAVVALDDSCVLLAQASESLSVIVAASFLIPTSNELLLQDCHWVLFEKESIGIMPVPAIAVMQFPDGHWAALESSTGALLNWPGRQPYLLHFLAKNRFEELVSDLDQLRVLTFLDFVVELFSKAPGFSSANGYIIAPPGYADAKNDDGEWQELLLPIPDEFRVA